MADAVPDTESLLEFVNKHYAGLKLEAEEDNKITPDPKKGEITAVIKSIDDLLKTVLDTTTSTHDTIVGQLKALRVAYEALKLHDTDATYTRYKDAIESLNMIVAGLEEVGGEELAPGVGGDVEAEVEPASGTASESALVLASRASAPASIAPASIASTASGPESKALVP